MKEAWIRYGRVFFCCRWWLTASQRGDTARVSRVCLMVANSELRDVYLCPHTGSVRIAFCFNAVNSLSSCLLRSLARYPSSPSAFQVPSAEAKAQNWPLTYTPLDALLEDVWCALRDAALLQNFPLRGFMLLFVAQGKREGLRVAVQPRVSTLAPCLPAGLVR
jgi:hypothetical protein